MPLACPRRRRPARRSRQPGHGPRQCGHALGDAGAAHDGTVNWSFDLANSEVQTGRGRDRPRRPTPSRSRMTAERPTPPHARRHRVITAQRRAHDRGGGVDGCSDRERPDPTLSDNGSITFDDADAHGPVSDAGVALSTTLTTGPAIPAGLATALASCGGASGDTAGAAHDGTVDGGGLTGRPAKCSTWPRARRSPRSTPSRSRMTAERPTPPTRRT